MMPAPQSRTRTHGSLGMIGGNLSALRGVDDPIEVPRARVRLRDRLRTLRSCAAWLRPHHQHKAKVDAAGAVVPVPSTITGCGVASNGAITTLMYRDAAKSAAVGGVQTCANLWECPTCAATISGERAREIVHAVNHQRAKGRHVYLVTFTFRHGAGEDLERLRRGLSRAWSYMLEGRHWHAWKKRERAHYVRRIELTHGALNGWHPHIHALIFTETEQDAERWTEELYDRFAVAVRKFIDNRADDHGWNYRRIAPLELPIPWVGSSSRRWLARFARAPLSRIRASYRFGLPSHVGDRNHAVKVDPVKREDAAAKYLSKLGLEMTDAFQGKEAKRGGRTPWQILSMLADRRWLEHDDAYDRDRELWLDYVAKMRGARQLTWSKGLRLEVGLADEESDQLIADRSAFDGRPVAVIPQIARSAILSRPHIVRPMLEAVERAHVFDLDTGETQSSEDLARILASIVRQSLSADLADAFELENREFDPADVTRTYERLRNDAETIHAEQRAAKETAEIFTAQARAERLYTPEVAERWEVLEDGEEICIPEGRAVWDYVIAQGAARGREIRERRKRAWVPGLRTHAAINPEDFRDYD